MVMIVTVKTMTMVHNLHNKKYNLHDDDDDDDDGDASGTQLAK